MSGNRIWQAKLAARVHDPAEKALVLLRDPAGHEGGTVRKLRDELFPKDGWKEWDALVRRADHWASAADRPQFPQDADNRFAEWARVTFTERPELKHPLTGETFDLSRLNELDIEHVKAVSLDHFKQLIQRDGDTVDWKKTLLAFWRFGPELGGKGLKLLWQLLPADTRVPDHTIWSHLDLTSAFAGAMAADEEGQPALLAVSFGPVQSFIAQARTTSDLWAGSHLLSRVAWEGLKVVCERLGPDAVLFPQLFGVPLVDAWIEEQLGGWPKAKDIKQPEWKEEKKKSTDANPLYAAALPNRFVAIVPASQAASIAEEVEQAARRYVMQQGEKALRLLREKAGVAGPDAADEQVEQQLAGFPECYWCAVPWSLVAENDEGVDVARLRQALAGFYPEKSNVGFLDSQAWKLLAKEIKVDRQSFYQPNGGVLYPALYDLLERSNAAVKTLRPFTRHDQKGYRCALCGEREWLTPNRSDLFAPPEKREAKLWQGLPDSWSRKDGEQLCALCAIKRLWPSLFADEVRKLLGGDAPRRFVVSTHAMALAADLVRKSEDKVPEGLKNLADEKNAERVALPAKLAARLKGKTSDFAVIPGILDTARNEKDEQQRRAIEKEVAEWLGRKPEAYYGLILFDGDKMGAWLQANEDFTRTTFADAWHGQVRAAVRGKAREIPALKGYLEELRPVSPARHAAISAALNGFALHLARFAVEEAHHGKLLYAGGDDVMAMVPVGELLSCMRLLRLLYAGAVPEGVSLPEGVRRVAHGFVHHRKRLLRVMGEKATASAGAVVAHHMAPLGRVLRELRAAEKAAKEEGGRDAFSIRVLKRGGGTVKVTARWFQESPLRGEEKGEPALPAHPSVVLEELAAALGSPHLSRRVAYHVAAQLRALPNRKQMPDGFEAMLEATLERQFRQQFQPARDKRLEENAQEKERVLQLARRVAALGCSVAQACRARGAQTGKKRQVREAEWLEGFFAVAEFLGREGRMGGES